MKKIGVILIIVCLISTAISIIGIIVANQGKVESITPDQLEELHLISEMPFDERPADGGKQLDASEHPKGDSFVQLVKKKTDNTLTGRLRLLEGLSLKYESMEAELYRAGGKLGTPEFKAELEEKFVTDVMSYGVYKEETYLTTWEKFCMFAVTYRSVMLVFGFLGLSFGIAIASSNTFKSDLDD